MTREVVSDNSKNESLVQSVPDEWEGILKPDEEILWQGKPDGGFYIHPSRYNSFGTGLLFCGVTVFFLFPAIADEGGLAWLFLLAFGGFSFFMLVSTSFWPIFVRRHSFYTLTTQRAIVGIALPFQQRRIRTFKISAHKTYEYVAGPLGSVIFDREFTGVEVNDVPQHFAVGFMRFSEAERVWEMINDLQNELSKND